MILERFYALQQFPRQRFESARPCAYFDVCLWWIYDWHWPYDRIISPNMEVVHILIDKTVMCLPYITLLPFRYFLDQYWLKVFKKYHSVYNSTEFKQSPGDVYNEYIVMNKLYKWQVMHLLTIRMKVCWKKRCKPKSVYVDVPHEILSIEDNFPTSLKLPIAKVLAILKNKINFHQDEQSSAKEKKSQNKKITFKGFCNAYPFLLYGSLNFRAESVHNWSNIGS